MQLIAIEFIDAMRERENGSSGSMLNNQIPPGTRANNYWDNFRRYILSKSNILYGCIVTYFNFMYFYSLSQLLQTKYVVKVKRKCASTV